VSHPEYGHPVELRNYRRVSLSDVYENNRGYHRLLQTGRGGRATTLVTPFTTSRTPSWAATSSLHLTILPTDTAEPFNSAQSSSNTVQSTNAIQDNTTTACTSVVGTPSPAFILSSVPGYTFRYACGTTVEDVEACPYLCGNFSPQQCSAVDLTQMNVSDSGPCHKCPVPCSNSSTVGTTISAPSFAGTTFFVPTLTNTTNLTTTPSITSSIAGSKCTSVPANATASPAFALMQNMWRLSCGQTAEDTLACPYLCEEAPLCAGNEVCGRRCASSSEDVSTCEQCLLPCSSSSTLLSTRHSTASASPLSSSSSVNRLNSALSAPTPTPLPTTGLHRFPSSVPIFVPQRSTCNPAAPTESPAIVVQEFAGSHFRIGCGRSIEDVEQCPWLCGNLCGNVDLAIFGGTECKECLPPCDPLTAVPTSGITIDVTAARITGNATTTTTTPICTTFPPTATPSDALYGAFINIDAWLRETCGVNYLEVVECPWLCGDFATRACAPRNVTEQYDVPCEQCLPPCSDHTPAFLPRTASATSNASSPTQNTTAIQPTPTCVDLPPAFTYIPNFYDPDADVFLREKCPVDTETSRQCPWLCGYGLTKLCSPTNLTSSYTHPDLGPLPCQKCPLICPVRLSNSFPNIEPNTTVPVDFNITVKTPSWPSTCTAAQPSPTPAYLDPFLKFSYRFSCATTVEEVQECAWLCGYPPHLRTCSPMNLTAELAPWYPKPCEQCLLPCGSNGTEGDTTLSPPGPTATPLKPRHAHRDNELVGRSPVLASATCPSPPSADCPYVCAEDGCPFQCSTNLYDADSTFSCITCEDLDGPSHRHEPRQRQKIIGSPTPYTGRALELTLDLTTAIYTYLLYHSGINLTTICEQLNVTAHFEMGLNGTAVKKSICQFAKNPPSSQYTPLEQVIGIAAPLFAVQVAGNYAGSSSLTYLCNEINYQVVSDLGFDGRGAQQFVCSEASRASLAPTWTITNLPSGVGFNAIRTAEGGVVKATPAGLHKNVGEYEHEIDVQ
jgi:hypothetical protein